ncbi:MAG TPA: peptide ABC transporter substrate-binding protein [Kofleriaceae bacterium]|nr:peptide ABC transporter substrate-binding protein [Kofleriaceae bacterium]
MRLAVALIVCASCSLPEGDYFGQIPDVHDRPRTLRFCNQGEPDYLDPALGNTTNATPILFAMFDGLTLYAPDGSAEPSLATSWDIAPDMRTFTFHLRKEGRFSNGRAIDAYDFAYAFLRLLDPTTASPISDKLEFVKNYDGYTGNTVRKLLHDAGPLKAGAVVELVDASDKTPDTNLRRSTHALELRDLGAPIADAYAHVPAGADVELVELTGGPVSYPSPAGVEWAYVFWDDGDGHYGWVPSADLDVAPNDDATYSIRAMPMRQWPGVQATPEVLAADDAAPHPTVQVKGRDLLRLPELIGMRIPDRYTFVIETPVPIPYVVASTPSQCCRVTPREVVSRWPRRWTDASHIVTSGPMHLKLWLEKDRVELVRSPTFWNQKIVKADEVIVFNMDDQAANTNYYAAGGCDAMASNNIPTSYLPVMNGEKHSYKDFASKPYNGIYFVYLNTEKLTNRHLRRALAYAIDRRPIPRIIHKGYGTSQVTPGTRISDLSDADRATCGVTRDQPGFAMIEAPGVCYVPPPGLDFDPAKAKEELALARQELGADFPKLTYRYNSGSEGHKLIAEYLQQSWQQVLGLDVGLESQEWKTFVKDTTDGQYQMARFGNIGSIADTESDFIVLFHCKAPSNRSRYCSPEFEKVYAEAKQIFDRKARNAKLAEAEKIMLEDAPVIPLYVYTQEHLTKPYVRDLPINFVDQVPLYRAWLDPDWNK